MKHLSEGTLRRLLDEPDEISEEEREHLESCDECKSVNGTIMEDVEVLTAMFGPELEVPDTEAALARITAAAANGSAVTEEVVPEAKSKTKAKRAAPPPPLNGGSRALMFVGRVFVAFGTLVMLFVGYQLLGTNFITNQEQKQLSDALESQWTSNVVDETPDLGQGVARMQIPKIGVDLVVVEGVEVPDLKKGPGHMPRTAMPGQFGNMVISGHRTTYGAPFNRIDELKVGDPIVVYSASGPHQYLVSEKKVVLPTAVEVAAPTQDARLTLTTCHPKFSARERLIIVADCRELRRASPRTTWTRGAAGSRCFEA